jgi:hypothetical protein
MDFAFFIKKCSELLQMSLDADDIEAIRCALSLFHQWGVCFYLNECPTLRNLVVLSMQFLAHDTFGAALKLCIKSQTQDGDAVQGLAGRIPVKDLKRALNAICKSPASLVALGKLLTKFDIGFPDNDRSPQFVIIPSCLPFCDAKLEFWTVDEFEFVQVLTFDFLPILEFVPRLIVRLQSSFLDSSSPIEFIELKMCRDYVVFHCLEQKGFIISSDENDLVLRVRGKNMRLCVSVMTLILCTIRQLLQCYPGVNFIPHALCPCKSGELVCTGRFNLYESSEPDGVYTCNKCRMPIPRGKVEEHAGLFLPGLANLVPITNHKTYWERVLQLEDQVLNKTFTRPPQHTTPLSLPSNPTGEDDKSETASQFYDISLT